MSSDTTVLEEVDRMSRRCQKFFWLGLILGLLSVLIAACSGSVPGIEAVEERSQTFAVRDYLSLTVETTNGKVEIWGVEGLEEVQATATLHAWGETQEQAQERLEKLTVEMNQEADRVSLQFRATGTYRALGKSPQVDFEVAIPAAADITVSVNNGNVTVADVTGTSSIETQNGSIDVTNVKGAVTGETANGSIDVTLSQAHLDLETDNGSITVSQSQCSLDAETDNGDIHFSGQLVGPQHRMKSANGSVMAEVPTDSELAIEASVGTGSISTTLPLSGDTQGKTWSAVLNAPTSNLSLQAGNGSIKIRGLAGI